MIANFDAEVPSSDVSWKCGICNSTFAVEHRAREMMFGLKEVFRYRECGFCGCLQIEPTPSNLGKYYPSDYYSFSHTPIPDRIPPKSMFSRYLFRIRNHGQICGKGWFGRILAKYRPLNVPEEIANSFPLSHQSQFSFRSRILDVGSGNGRFLITLAELGFRNLTGIDPFLAADSRPHRNVVLRSCTLESLRNLQFDIITLNHSLEHMPDQLQVLQQIRKLLSPNGFCVIRIPILGRPWREYGPDWVELDAPRHLFLHTLKSLGLVASKAGFEVIGVRGESLGISYWGSELYRKDVTLIDPIANSFANPYKHFSEEFIRGCEKQAEIDNRTVDGSRGVFWLEPI